MSSNRSGIDIVEVLKDLVSLDTSVPPGNNYEKTVEYLEELFEEVGWDTEKVRIPAKEADGRTGRVNLLAHKRNRDMPRLIFYSHIDVVPVEGWKGFNPVLENGKFYGRGSADMKGAIPALLSALEKIKDENSDIGYDVSVMVTTDEEIGQSKQLEYLRQFLEPVDDAYVFNLDAEAGFVTVASLGAVQVKLEVRGKSVHSGLAHLGKNAVEDSISLMESIKELKKKVVSRKSDVDANPATGLEKMEARLNINEMHGGTKENIVPDRCTISLDRRFIPEEKMEEVEVELLDTLNSLKDVDWKVLDISRVQSYNTQSSKVEKLESLVEEVTGKSGRYGMMGSCEIYPVASNWGAVVFGIGVIRPDSNIHGKKEFVRISDIEDLGEIIYKFLTV